MLESIRNHCSEEMRGVTKGSLQTPYTLLDGYSEDEFESVCRALWTLGTSSPECYFYTLLDTLLDHYMLTRGGDRRAAEISDLFIFQFKDEGPSQCMPFIFTTRAGNQNQFGRQENNCFFA
ncbi:hypothetical protein EYZ11_008838 [Aspergillus tanneri]|uniref:Ndc10 domain-containing protein n=1 Tax=Aspergillus tanneri TaxID=1220188 RepID=A0A4S3J9F0_9EURO|nr:hypothetical protein EYZ11_008838 [Aspergillus tanneri]